MAVTVTDNTPNIGAKMSANIPIALRFILEDVHREANPITPRDTGDLRTNVLKEVSGHKGTIAWNQNYAIFPGRKQYTNYTTSGTGPYFDVIALGKVIPNFKQYLQRARIIL